MKARSADIRQRPDRATGLLELFGTESVGWLVSSRSIVEDIMGFGRGILLWLLGVPIPIIILLALFWHH
jgi:hypothetical protein